MYLVFVEVFSVVFFLYKKQMQTVQKNLPFCRNNLFLHLGEVQKFRQDVEVLLNLKTDNLTNTISEGTFTLQMFHDQNKKKKPENHCKCPTPHRNKKKK